MWRAAAMGFSCGYIMYNVVAGDGDGGLKLCVGGRDYCCFLLDNRYFILLTNIIKVMIGRYVFSSLTSQ